MAAGYMDKGKRYLLVFLSVWVSVCVCVCFCVRVYVSVCEKGHFTQSPH